MCKGQLGDATAGTDVRIRNGLLSCHECYIASRGENTCTHKDTHSARLHAHYYPAYDLVFGVSWLNFAHVNSLILAYPKYDQNRSYISTLH